MKTELSSQPSINNDRAEIESRARAIADLEGRTHVTDEDRVAAVEQIHATSVPGNPIDIPDGTSVDTSDEIAVSRGHQVPNQPLEDEANIAEKLIEGSGFKGPVQNSPRVADGR